MRCDWYWLIESLIVVAALLQCPLLQWTEACAGALLPLHGAETWQERGCVEVETLEDLMNGRPEKRKRRKAYGGPARQSSDGAG